jgi:hypothetical protein
MDTSTRGPEPSPAHDRASGPELASQPADDDLWFELRGRDGTVTGTSSRVIHRRADGGGGWAIHEWHYEELRSLQVTEAGDGGSIVIEPRHGPLVPIAVGREQREEAFQAATVFNLLIARAQRQIPVRGPIRR